MRKRNAHLKSSQPACSIVMKEGGGGGGGGGGGKGKSGGGLSSADQATAKKAADIAKNNPQAKNALKNRIENIQQNLDRARRQMKEGLAGTNSYNRSKEIAERLEKQLPVMREALRLSNQ